MKKEQEVTMAERTFTIEGTLSALLEGKKYSTIKDILVTMNPSDVAAVFEDMEEDRLPLLFRLLLLSSKNSRRLVVV